MYYKELERIRDGRFVILDHIRKITTAKGDHPTISLAIGTGNTPALSYKYAQKALTMALGRGGDQAVIGNGTEFVYYEMCIRDRSYGASCAVSFAAA